MKVTFISLSLADDSISAASTLDVQDRLSSLELRVQQQEDELMVMKAALADVLRRLAQSEDSAAAAKKQQSSKGNLALRCVRVRLCLQWSSHCLHGGSVEAQPYQDLLTVSIQPWPTALNVSIWIAAVCVYVFVCERLCVWACDLGLLEGRHFNVWPLKLTSLCSPFNTPYKTHWLPRALFLSLSRTHVYNLCIFKLYAA